MLNKNVGSINLL